MTAITVIQGVARSSGVAQGLPLVTNTGVRPPIAAKGRVAATIAISAPHFCREEDSPREKATGQTASARIGPLKVAAILSEITTAASQTSVGRPSSTLLSMCVAISCPRSSF